MLLERALKCEIQFGRTYDKNVIEKVKMNIFLKKIFLSEKLNLFLDIRFDLQ